MRNRVKTSSSHFGKLRSALSSLNIYVAGIEIKKNTECHMALSLCDLNWSVNEEEVE